jgi:hypothetical protein
MIHDQVKEVGLGEVRVGYNNRKFDFYASKAIGPQSGLEVALIDAFFAQAAQFVLTGEGMSHDTVVDPFKLVGLQRPDRQGASNGHGKHRMGQGNENDERATASGTNVAFPVHEFNPPCLFPCPHSLVLLP